MGGSEQRYETRPAQTEPALPGTNLCPQLLVTHIRQVLVVRAPRFHGRGIGKGATHGVQPRQDAE